MNNIEEYKKKLFAARALGNLSGDEVAEMMEKLFGIMGTGNKYRKDYERHYKIDIERELSKDILLREHSSSNDDVNDIRQTLKDIRLEKVKLSDERVQNNAFIRRMAREDTIKEIAHEYAKQMNKDKVLEFHPVSSKFDLTAKQEGILCLSDWHYGIVVDSYFNKYDPDVCKERIQTLQDKVISKGLKLGVSKIHVVNLADLIAGRIHQTIRLQSRIDTVTQIMDVSEILAEFLANLSSYFKIEYYDCLDNHSRLEPNKSESLDLESLARITKWFLKERLANRKDVIYIHDNIISEDIITFEVLGHKIVAAHGHKDKSSKVIDNLTLFTKEHYDLVLSAHEHHFSADEKNNTIRFSSGTLMGSDDYSESLRLTSTPSQLFIVASEDNVTEYVCRIIVE